jgi:hypothetical protein
VLALLRHRGQKQIASAMKALRGRWNTIRKTGCQFPEKIMHNQKVMSMM